MHDAVEARIEPASKALRAPCSANTVTASAAVAPKHREQDRQYRRGPGNAGRQEREIARQRQAENDPDRAAKQGCRPRSCAPMASRLRVRSVRRQDVEAEQAAEQARERRRPGTSGRRARRGTAANMGARVSSEKLTNCYTGLPPPLSRGGGRLAPRVTGTVARCSPMPPAGYSHFVDGIHLCARSWLYHVPHRTRRSRWDGEACACRIGCPAAARWPGGAPRRVLAASPGCCSRAPAGAARYRHRSC